MQTRQQHGSATNTKPYNLLCRAGYTLCGDSPNAVCLNLQTDSQHCGTCTTACTGNNECKAGSCSCKPGFANCAEGSSGCETDLQSDAAHCGACGTACPAGNECRAGACACGAGEVYGYGIWVSSDRIM